MAYQTGNNVTHPNFGTGEIILDRQETVIVRFDHGIEECESNTLSPAIALPQIIASGKWQAPQPVILRGLAATIDSLNDRWSIFSRSRVKLLPHQLWVCRTVSERWPFRWLIADDVGLGKTIEAGLILWPLISRKVVKRVLIFAPASLTEQWVMRLRQMFDLRFSLYSTEADTPRSSFWETHNQVVASLQTLRDDRKGRHERLLNAPGWDLAIVDEAHHVNADEKTGATLNFQLLQKLQNHQKLESIIFFTGTPHRGKDYNFISLLKLLRPEVFEDAKKPLEEYLPNLRSVMIRNNKQNVTDLRGNLLFKGVKTQVVTYHYSVTETVFYETLTQFILSGRAYASSLDGFIGRAVNLVLTALQKLASSSVAAVRSALQKRLGKIRVRRDRLDNLKVIRRLLALAESEDSDDYTLAELDTQIMEESFSLQLIENEEEYLERLIVLSEQVTQETRIQRILELLEGPLANRSVLFFTEYKVTQSLLMTALVQRYGEFNVTFINGDNQANNINGKTLRCPRERAVELFNSGQVIFLVSTEAAGEGVDLQQNCYTLIHVDLPWNPMRLHQRVGRLYRYGQGQTVEVMTLRNPDTIEATIWERLEEKMHRIQLALSGVMEEQEDLFPMVLGMTSPSIWTELFSEAPSIPRETLTKWFDSKTKRFGGEDALQTVHTLIGHCASFDYRELGGQLIDIDLPSLIPFFTGMLTYNHRQFKETEEGLAFITPESWMSIGIQTRYEDLVFDRNFQGANADRRIIGVGNPLMEKALDQARNIEDSIALLPSDVLAYPLLLFRLSDRVTERSGSINSIIVGVEHSKQLHLLQDHDLIKRLNNLIVLLPKKLDISSISSIYFEMLQNWISDSNHFIQVNLDQLDLPFRVPEVRVIILLCPDNFDFC